MQRLPRLQRRPALVGLLGLLALCALPLQAMPLGRGVPLAQELAAGSPWVFRTRYEETQYHFRFSEAEVLEWKRISSGQEGGTWRPVESEDGARLQHKTINGHVITIELDKDGHPTAQHSKHAVTFRRLQD